MSALHEMTLERLAGLIDHTVLSPASGEDELRRGAEIARRFRTASFVVKPAHVSLAARYLDGADVRVATVVGFPHGGSTVETKAFETADAVGRGAGEVDMVINIAALRTGDLDYVRREIAAVVEAAASRPVKVILETAALSDEGKAAGARLAAEAGAAYVKTSTGYGQRGATAEDVRLLVDAVAGRIGVKASGGIRTLDQVMQMLQAGATRIGTSATKSILHEFEALASGAEVRR